MAQVSVFHLIESSFELNIFCDGDARLKRRQLCVPVVSFDRYAEQDFYKSGGSLKDSQFKVFVVDVSTLDTIEGHIVLFDTLSTRLITKYDKTLEANRTYMRTLDIDAPCAFADSMEDAFIVRCTTGSDSLAISVTFDGRCQIVPNKTEFSQISEKGSPLASPIMLSLKYVSANSIVVTKIDKSERGDRYMLKWKYAIGPSHTKCN